MNAARSRIARGPPQSARPSWVRAKRDSSSSVRTPSPVNARRRRKSVGACALLAEASSAASIGRWRSRSAMRSLEATDRAWTISPFEIKSEIAVIAPTCVDSGASLVGLASDTGRMSSNAMSCRSDVASGSDLHTSKALSKRTSVWRGSTISWALASFIPPGSARKRTAAQSGSMHLDGHVLSSSARGPGPTFVRRGWRWRRWWWRWRWWWRGRWWGSRRRRWRGRRLGWRGWRWRQWGWRRWRRWSTWVQEAQEDTRDAGVRLLLHDALVRNTDATRAPESQRGRPLARARRCEREASRIEDRSRRAHARPVDAVPVPLPRDEVVRPVERNSWDAGGVCYVRDRDPAWIEHRSVGSHTRRDDVPPRVLPGDEVVGAVRGKRLARRHRACDHDPIRIED